MATNYDIFLEQIIALRRGVQSGRQKPHKIIMLLAVVDMAEDGLLRENRIYFQPDLLARFERNFRAYSDSTDLCQPAPPFFHLRSSNFWHHEIKEGREEAYSKLNTSGGGSRRITDNIAYAFLSDYAYEVISGHGFPCVTATSVGANVRGDDEQTIHKNSHSVP